MQRLMSRTFVLALATFLLGSAGCGPKPAGKLPVSSPVYAFQEPDAEDFAPADEDEDTDTDAVDAPAIDDVE